MKEHLSLESTEETRAVVPRFENGFNARNWDATMAEMTQDFVFEHVAPAAVSFGSPRGGRSRSRRLGLHG